MKNIILNNIEYRQTTSCPKVYIAKDGSYILPNSNNPEKIRFGTKSYSKKGYPLQVMICSSVFVIVDDKQVAKRVVKNAGRLVLDAWKNEVDDTMEVDHIDRNPFNNNLDNLRLVSKSENIRNKTKFDCFWLHTPEVAKKRVETKLAKKNGTYVEETKEIVEKVSFEDTVRENRKRVETNRKMRRISSINDKINKLEEKLVRWSHNKSINYNKIVRKLEELKQEKNELESL